VCGRAPVYTETVHRNHTFRCDGDLANPSLSPRHTVYVFSADKDEAAMLWNKAALAEPEDATALAVRELTELRAFMVAEHDIVDHAGGRSWYEPVNLSLTIDEIDARLAKLRQGETDGR
jgi:hypothetical protein